MFWNKCTVAVDKNEQMCYTVYNKIHIRKEVIKIQTQIDFKGYGTISKYVMQDKKLSPYAKAIYSYLKSYCGNKNECFPSIKKICFDLNINKDTYYMHLNMLVGMGLVTVKHVKNNGKFARNSYTVSENIGYDNVGYETVGYEETETNNNKTKINRKKNNTLSGRAKGKSEYDNLTFEDFYEMP